MTQPRARVRDRRIQKTQSLLREALISLIHEKNYDSIAIQEILDRANVGRSTFYTHFRDKDDLLVSGIHEMLRSAEPADPRSSARLSERILSFSLPIFEYQYRHRNTTVLRIGIKGRAIIHGHLQRVIADLIAEDVKRDFRRQNKTSVQIPPGLVVQYIASTFILVLNWWVDSRNPIPPNDVNNLFRALVLPALAGPRE